MAFSSYCLTANEVFETRNKLYGAYQLRTQYDRRIAVAVAAVSLAFSAAVASPLFLSNGPDDAQPEVTEREIILADLETPPLPVEPPPAPEVPRLPEGGEPAITITEAPPLAATDAPVIVPDEEVAEDVPVAFETGTDVPEASPGGQGVPGGSGQGGQGSSGGTGTGAGEGSAPQAGVFTNPRPMRFAEAEYPREARRRNVRAEVVIRVLVNEKGAVQRSEIVERYRFTDKGKERVNEIGFGVEQSALTAAGRWRFRPARLNDKPVEGYATLTLGFGV